MNLKRAVIIALIVSVIGMPNVQANKDREDELFVIIQSALEPPELPVDAACAIFIHNSDVLTTIDTNTPIVIPGFVCAI